MVLNGGGGLRGVWSMDGFISVTLAGRRVVIATIKEAACNH
jgi:hypothetical protein